MKSCGLCTLGIQAVMHIGPKRWRSKKEVARTVGVVPAHKSKGRKSHNAVKDSDVRGFALKEHFEYLLELGECRATRVIATLVDGKTGHTNRDDTVNMVYLPISMGYRNCYKRYMARLGYDVSCKPNGAIVVDGIDGKVVDPGEYVSLQTYFSKWKSDYPQLKVSRPAEDICQYCYVFAHRHRYLAKHSSAGGVTCLECDEDGNDVICISGDDSIDVECDEDDNDVIRISGDDSIDDEVPEDGGGSTGGEDAVTTVDKDRGAECAPNKEDEERELLMLEAALHVSMARVQRSLYQSLIEKAKGDVNKSHSECSYLFVVDYGQNMELPVYNSEQPGCTYYYSPLSVYNLGMVNHAHVYPDGTVGEHMYAHVYNEGVGKKGANNVASLVVKTLQHLNLL
jgi:hypothetical protein